MDFSVLAGQTRVLWDADDRVSFGVTASAEDRAPAQGAALPPGAERLGAAGRRLATGDAGAWPDPGGPAGALTAR